MLSFIIRIGSGTWLHNLDATIQLQALHLYKKFLGPRIFIPSLFGGGVLVARAQYRLAKVLGTWCLAWWDKRLAAVIIESQQPP